VSGGAPVHRHAVRGGAALWAAYRAAGRFAAPLAGPHLRRRARAGKEDPQRLAEKTGVASAGAGERPVWLHAVSVGESVAAIALARRIAAEGFCVLLTTGTPAAAARVAEAGLLHQYAPLDAPPFVARFLDHWRPRAALFTEAEVWPATLHALAAAGIPRAHVNARLSERSFRRWAKLPALSRPLFRLIPLALAQSETDAARFDALGVGSVMATGNLKFDAEPPAADAAACEAMALAIGPRPVWAAASLHPGEEKAVVAAHRSLAALRPGLATIIAPRHPAAAGGVIAAAAAAGLARPARRSLGELPRGGLYLFDTLGEMGTLLSLARVVFLGGSLVPLGGHNPAEPAAFGAAILTGPSAGPMFAPFLAADAARVVTDAEGLAGAVATLLDDPAAAAAMGERAGAVLRAERGAVERTMRALAPTLAAARQAR